MLYLITNRNLIKNGSLTDVIEEAVKGGVDAVILREKDLSTEELLPMVYDIKNRIKDTGAKLIINSNFEAAKIVNAEGYHCSFEVFIRERPKFCGFIGVSVHTLEESIEAQRKGADYIMVSHIFWTDCKKGLEPKGLDFIKTIKSNVNIPVIALGGINKENAKKVMNAGADGIAVMSSIMAAENPKLFSQQLKREIKVVL